MKVLIVNGGIAYARMLAENGFDIAFEYEEADIIQFTGGEDVSPFLYGELPHPQTFYSAARDAAEIEIFHRAVKDRKPMIGICRGGQFLNVANGGRMLQHVDNHAINGTHPAIDVHTGRTINVTSTHHQMMVAGAGGEVLAVAYLSTVREGMVEGGDLRVERGEHTDTEVVFYPDTKSLCFQPHPEFGGAKECRDYYFELINQHIL